MINVNNQKKDKRSVQELAWLLILVFSISLFSPEITLASGGGPTQPEVQGFTPIGMSDMVDPFTGDFTYNIPLMDVEGYPLNISYGSGITMDQEASWVGLGWNLNVGSILRSMRGIPDDFNGDSIIKITHQKPQLDMSLSVDAKNLEFFGKDVSKKIKEGTQSGDTTNSLSVSLGININYNNYRGWGAAVNFGPSFNLKSLNKSSSFGLNLTGSSENGAGFSPSFSMSKSVSRTDLNNTKLTNRLGAGFNSRAGLSEISFSRTLNAKAEGKSVNYTAFQSGYSVGLRHYTPSSSPSYSSKNLTGRVTTSLTMLGADGQIQFGLSLNESNIDTEFKKRINPAYGYFNLNVGQHNQNALLDFNRDNDETFTKYTPYLASAFLTGDLFSVQAQGISGSFRGYRNEIGYVFDPATTTNSVTGNLGYEFGLGDANDNGFDLSGSVVHSYTGAWKDNTNKASAIAMFEDNVSLSENYALQEANERSVDTDPLFGTTFSKTTAESFHLDGLASFPVLKSENTSGHAFDVNNRSSRIKRNQVISFLTIAEVKAGLGLNNPSSNLYANAPGHHIGEITQLGTDGRRYVFGLPAYNTYQEDVTMSVGNDLGGDDGLFPSDHYNGLIDLSTDFSQIASKDNKLGIDHYYSEQRTPAYAHSFLLTAVLSDDYVDSDTEKGPSENDLGSYVKVDYQKVDNVKWRTPMPLQSAYFNQGLKSDATDDKASFVYGTKELLYVKKIETKNYVAVFFLQDRLDGTSSTDRSGGLDPTAGKMQCLKKICLYTKKEFKAHETDLSTANALQEVHFVYDYSLCPGYVANATGGGKLTLKEIYFVYQGSYKMKRSSYRFEYNSGNAAYNMKAVDRWGTYQATGSGTLDYTNSTNPLPQGDFPYTTQDKTTADANVQQWTLTDIHLPSGGKIKVEYESDDYAFVQNMEASQMYPIVATGDPDGVMNTISTGATIAAQDISTSSGKNRAIFFKLKSGYTDISKYGKSGQAMYFKCLVNVGKHDHPSWEYVSGYAFIQSITRVGDYGKIVLTPVKMLDHASSSEYSPIAKTAIQFARMNLSRTINDIDINGPGNSSENGLLNTIGAIAGAFTSFGELVTGPNLAIYDKGKCQEILPQRSFIRLLEPSKRKLGGGLRVKSIKMYDNWKKMVTGTTPDPDNFSYGQEFSYTLEDGVSSSGVASYEPAIGGDENSMTRPRFYENEIKFAPDYDMFIETPLMESQFPNPSVGYSRVVIKDLKPSGVSIAGTGKVIKEFYTAKDFPVIVSATDLDYKKSRSIIPYQPQYEYLTATQGFSIELNDMHGKPKSEAVYAENKTAPISSVEYHYQMSEKSVNGISSFRLDNNVTTVRKDGTTSTAEIGVKYEAVADFRETATKTTGAGPIELNVNAFFAGPAFLVIPTIWTHIDIAEDRFRTATLNKIVNKFGIQNRVTANQDGSIVETQNLAYDAETGEVLATQTTNDFNDAVYSLTFPAHWKYDQLGMAYKNIGYSVSGYPIGADGFMPVGSLSTNFVEGDEVIVTKNQAGNPKYNAWVTKVTPSGIRLVDKSGAAIVATNASVKIIRSGRRNKQTLPMGSITTNQNPLSGLVSGNYQKVLNAGSVELSENWGTYCKCFSARDNGYVTTNPFVKGTRGNWRPVRSYTYLTDRTQSTANGNSNTRIDGTFAGFSPYYYYQSSGAQWLINPSNWTYVSEVTQFSPNGTTLETRDALGRYSASLLSFKNTLTTAVSANAMRNQIAEGSFEDVGYINCMDQGIFTRPAPANLSTSEYHTGHNSLKVPGGGSVYFGEVDQECNPDVNCSLSLTATSATTYSLTGNADNYNFTTISGTGSVSITGNVMTVTYSSATYFELVVSIYDKDAACNIKVKIFNSLNDLTHLNTQLLSVNPN